MIRAVQSHERSDPQSDPNPPAWLSIREAASYLGVGPRLVRRLVREGRLPARRLHGAAHIPKEAIDRILDPFPRGPT